MVTVKVKGGMALRNGIWNGMRNDMRNDCGMAKRIKFRDIFFVWRFFKFHFKTLPQNTYGSWLYRIP